MFKTNILLAYRSLMKEKGFTLINTIGLALGLACFVMVMVYVIHEFSYEHRVPDNDRIYRVYFHGGFDANMENSDNGFMPYPMTQYLKRTYPEVEDVISIDQSGGDIISYKDTYFQEWRALLADSNFFNVFPTEFIKGTVGSALVGNHKVVLTESSAKKWFGNEDPMGKMMKVGRDSVLFEVTSVVKDPSSDTHVKYSMLLSDGAFDAGKKESWLQSRGRFNYVKLKKGTSAAQFESKLQEIIPKCMEPEYQTLLGKSLKEILGSSPMPTIKLQNTKDIHLYSTLSMDVGGVTGNRVMVLISLAIAIAILLLAIINFINLSTARFANRMKEVCVKKTCGATRLSLLGQFLGESYLLTAIATLIALAIVELFIKPFCDSLMLEYIISFYRIPGFWLFIVAVIVVVGFFSGAYPALVMSRVNITSGLKGKASAGSAGRMLRKTLVVAQFCISFAILVGAIVINQQIDYILADNKGYTRTNLYILHNATDMTRERRKAFKQELLKIEGVKDAAFASWYPNSFQNEGTFWKGDDATKTRVKFAYQGGDYNYAKTLGLTLMKGRYPEKNNLNDTLSILINETAARQLGYENPIGKQLKTESSQQQNHEIALTIVGVVRDFNQMPVKSAIIPMLIFCGAEGGNWKVLMRLDGKNNETTLKQVSKLWKTYTISGNNLFYESMDDSINWVYRGEQSTKELVSTFSIICIIIACLGLIGLVSYSTLRRTKEIGIRKANGATVMQIVYALSRETIILISIAVVIALPLSYVIVDRWLGQFAYHVDLSAGVFATAIITLYAIALLSEMTLTVKAARQNPVKALRYE